MKSIDDKDVELMCDFLNWEFPKKRVKKDPSLKNSKKFVRGVIIPCVYSSVKSGIYPYSNQEEMHILFQALKGILDRTFAFKEDNIHKALLLHFNLL